jgi:hypothetical protein
MEEIEAEMHGRSKILFSGNDGIDDHKGDQLIHLNLMYNSRILKLSLHKEPKGLRNIDHSRKSKQASA